MAAISTHFYLYPIIWDSQDYNLGVNTHVSRVKEFFLHFALI